MIGNSIYKPFLPNTDIRWVPLEPQNSSIQLSLKQIKIMLFIGIDSSNP